ncbi:MAG: hypothetical protein H0V09_01995 [Gemmatimonadetes bacterium]|nr:hypothetical protein [Gemmatimonadota bacterium]
MNAKHLRRGILLLTFGLSLVRSSEPVYAQLGGLGDAVGKIGKKAPNVTAALQGKPPITTQLADATFGIDSSTG